jgi:serine/threonine-protein kinase RsbW
MPHSSVRNTPQSCPVTINSDSLNHCLLPGPVTYTLDSTMDALDFLEHVAVEVARQADFHGDALEKIGLAVHEIAANAVIHGNQFDSRKKVVATIVRTREQIKITVSDGGAGFELERLPDPRSPEALLKDSGRGIYLARAFMDEFHVQTPAAGGTTVTLIKYIRGSRLK